MDRRFFFSVLFFLSCGEWAAFAPSAAAHDPLPPIILQLGDSEFERRIEAERTLLNGGPAGLNLIDAGVRSSDPEIRQRSLRLQELLQKAAFAQQRDRIRDDPWTVSAELAPAWEEYQQLVGDSPAARDLYVRMIEQEGDLMLAVVLRPEFWTADFERRCADLRTFMSRRGNRDLDPISILALLFLAEHPDNQISSLSAQTLASFLGDSLFHNAVLHASIGEVAVYHALLSRWIETATVTSAPSRLQLASKFGLSAGLVPAKELIDNRNAVGQSRTQLQNAIRFLAEYGSPADIRLLEPLLENVALQLPTVEPEPVTRESLSHPTAPVGQVDLMVSDLALLGLIKLTGQDPQPYGFVDARRHLDHRYNANSPNFSKEEDRRAALLRWQAWRVDHPLFFKDAPEDASVGW